MKKIFLALILLQISACALLDPSFYIWKTHDGRRPHSNQKIMPWSGIGKKPIYIYKEYSAMTPTGYSSDAKWYISFFNKSELIKFPREVGKFLTKNKIIHQYGFKYSKHGNGIFSRANLPYELKIISVSPLFVTMRPYGDTVNSNNSQENEYFPSEYLVNPIYYGTTLKYQSSLLYFSPDLDILPQPLNLKKGKKTTIYWNRFLKSGAIEFEERNGVVYTKRIKNKTSKDAKKDPSYNHDYHLKLISLEKRN